MTTDTSEISGLRTDGLGALRQTSHRVAMVVLVEFLLIFGYHGVTVSQIPKFKRHQSQWCGFTSLKGWMTYDTKSVCVCVCLCVCVCMCVCVGGWVRVSARASYSTSAFSEVAACNLS